jgi:stage II sporulation protein AA (anti-sigma F factor antagonist)
MHFLRKEYIKDVQKLGGQAMQVTSRIDGNTLYASLSGELDDHCAPDVRNELEQRLANKRITELALDMSGITFMDSSGLGVILGRYRTITRRGGRLTITGASKYAQRILKMAGIYSLVNNGEGKSDV